MVRKYTIVNTLSKHILLAFVLSFGIFEIYLRCSNVVGILAINNPQNS